MPIFTKRFLTKSPFFDICGFSWHVLFHLGLFTTTIVQSQFDTTQNVNL